MQRGGYGDQPGLIYVLNNRGDRWDGAWVNTQWRRTELSCIAWWSRVDMAQPVSQQTDFDGRAQFFAAPRGYAVYVVK
jgi:alpha-amylase